MVRTTRVVIHDICTCLKSGAELMYRSSIPFYHRSNIYLYTTHQPPKVPFCQPPQISKVFFKQLGCHSKSIYIKVK